MSKDIEPGAHPRLGQAKKYNPIAAILTVAAILGSAGESAAQGAYPREQTLYTGGTQWGNVVGFNPYVGNYAPGTTGLVFETLVRYDPLKDRYIPWLAETGEWTTPNVFTMTIRSGIEWNDGSPFSAEDVKWNIELGRLATVPWHILYQGIESVEAKGSTVAVTFKGTPKYQDWHNQIWNHMPMVQPAQWQDHANETEITSWSPEAPIGTGPYVLDQSGYDPTTRTVWMKNPRGWWAAEAGLLPDPKPRYIIDLVNSSNNVALGLLLNGQEDLNNNFLPGINTLITGGYGLQTYYPKAPYMLSANTAWLVPNVTKAPLDDARFRRALAFAINVDQIVTVDYGNLVLKANPTGLLPTWQKYVDTDSVKTHGFTYDPNKARAVLDEAGYVAGDDGRYRQPNGDPISLKIAVPAGWSDWMQAVQMIAADAKAVGIELVPAFPDFNNWQTERNTGKFDLIIDNDAQLSDTPFTYYRYLYKLPVLDSQTNFNFSRIENQKAWELVNRLDMTQRDDLAAMKSIIKELQTITMQEMPQIPLWYNGVWSQVSTAVWTNWPTADSDRNFMPTMWRGYLQMTGIDTISHLRLATPQ